MASYLRTTFVVVTCGWLSGCAYLTTYTRSIDLENGSYSLDVKQRVVLSTTRADPYNENKKIRVVCAEPSPDALTVISASAGVGAANAIAAGANRSTERQSGSDISSSGMDTSSSVSQNVNVAAALAEQGAFVGLRTQSIQLLRDTMYRLCEGYASGAIPEEEFTAMQRRYQSTMMGLLAIEQLTRPVVAAQVVLASTATSKSGPSAADGALDKARARLDEKERDVTAAKVAFDEMKGNETAARNALDENISKERSARESAAKASQGDESAKKQAADEAAKPFLDARPDLQRSLREATTSLEGKATILQAAQRARDLAETDLNAAKSAALASAGGGGNMGSIREASAQITAYLTNGVYFIVQEINNSYTRDGCFALIQRSVSRSRSDTPPALLAALELCTSILNRETRLRESGEFVPFRMPVPAPR